MQVQFLQSGLDKRLAHTVEECGEVISAIGKTQRFGLRSVNPLLPLEQQERNVDWLRREMADLRGALDRLDAAIEEDLGRPD
jgi:NTP pyrophosphatase (non-canonical NTP hydrolase)